MKKSANLINKVRSTIQQHHMVVPGDKIIVALSAGPDSICLLDLLNKLSPEMNIKIVVAHFDHGLRENEDERETQLSKDIAQSMNLPFETEKAPGLLKNHSSLEEKAREARYAFLEKVHDQHGAQKIAMGHTLNDQAETVLMRLLRGSGSTGLAGIPPVRDGRIIRPLIDCNRDEIMHYINSRSLPYAIDSSNSNKRHLRNRIRHELIPMMLEYQPRLLDRLGTISNIFREEDTLLETMALDWIDAEKAKDSQGDIIVSASSLRRLPDPLKTRVIRDLLKSVKGDVYPMEYDHIISVSGLLDNEHPQCSIDLPNGIIASKVYDTLCFRLKSYEDAAEYNYLLEGPGTYYIDAVRQTLMLDEVDGSNKNLMNASRFTALLDANRLSYPLTVRNFRHGDRFVPMGMTGHKKVKDFFIDLKVPSKERAMTPIITINDEIVWICGYRIDERFKVTSQTKKMLKITIKQEG
jgi:tRNA(Ile)-lysidine synthase